MTLGEQRRLKGQERGGRGKSEYGGEYAQSTLHGCTKMSLCDPRPHKLEKKENNEKEGNLTFLSLMKRFEMGREVGKSF